MWSGAPTSETLRVKVRVEGTGVPVLHVGRAADLSDGQVVLASAAWPLPDGFVVDYDLAGLSPDTAYVYRVGQDWGGFRTLPRGPASFTLALGSCAETGSSHPVFATIARHQPLFFLHTGDLHYEDIKVNDVAVFRSAFDRVLTATTQAALYRGTPVVYVWDDHDFGPNNSDATAPGRLAARYAFRENVPHYPLAVPAVEAAIYHAFTVGRVRFVVSDARSERMPPSVPDTAEKTMLGVEQKAWLKQEFLAARDAQQLIVWVNSVPWLGTSSGLDSWSGFTHERAELANFIVEHGITALCVVSGDAHMLAIDDGSNNRYADGGGPGFPVFQAAALDRRGSVKGGPYSHGTYPGGGQFGLMRVIDDGGAELRIEWSGRNFRDEEVVAHRFVVALPRGP
jgi:phosphodiesterase/alkaline phosphatase D-like protein